MQLGEAEQQRYIKLEVKISALKRILRCQELHISDVHCQNAEEKALLQRLLLQAITSNKWPSSR